MFSSDNCVRTSNDYYVADTTGLNFNYSDSDDLDSDNNNILDTFEADDNIVIDSSIPVNISDPFKTYVFDDSTSPKLYFSDVDVAYDQNSPEDSLYKPLTSGSVTYQLSDFNDRFNLLEKCDENGGNTDSHTYRCLAGDLTSKFYRVNDGTI